MFLFSLINTSSKTIKKNTANDDRNHMGISSKKLAKNKKYSNKLM